MTQRVGSLYFLLYSFSFLMSSFIFPVDRWLLIIFLSNIWLLPEVCLDLRSPPAWSWGHLMWGGKDKSSQTGGSGLWAVNGWEAPMLLRNWMLLLSSYVEDCIVWFDFVFVFKGQCLFGQSICLSFQGWIDHWRCEQSPCSQTLLMGLW